MYKPSVFLTKPFNTYSQSTIKILEYKILTSCFSGNAESYITMYLLSLFLIHFSCETNWLWRRYYDQHHNAGRC